MADGLCSAAIEFRQSCVSSKPHRAVWALGNREHAVRWQTMKQRDRAPLVQAS